MKKALVAVLAVITVTAAAAVHTAAAKKITEEKAKAIAFKDAGISAEDAERVTVKLENDDGVLEYDVEFYIGNLEYDYEISAKNGKILSRSVEEDDDRPAATTNVQKAKITEEEAKKIAFKDAGVSEKDAELVTVKLDYDDGVLEYDIEFYIGNTEYDYEISAKSGKILSKSVDKEDDRPAASATAQKTKITKEKAKKIAFKDAGVSAKDAERVTVKLDYDDGAAEYDVEFYVGNTEYDYEISAETGKILSKSVEKEDDRPAANTAKSTGITIDEAKKIALKKVPGAKDKNIKIKLDRDDGKTVYEGKIVYKETEYEFEIDAESGRILEWESESIYD